MHRWAALIFPVVALAATPDVRPPDFRVERQPVANGAELLTIFSSLPENTGEIPLVSVLRDTLGDNDPNNDRLRYIWVLTSARPTVLQHTAAFIPFFYWRPDLGKNMDRKPAAILDLGNTSKVVWNALAQSVVQAAAIDSNGALIRASTRRYRANLADQRQVNLMEGLTIVSQLEEMPEAEALFSVPELLEIQARLALAGKTLGGLVQPSASRKPTSRIGRRPARRGAITGSCCCSARNRTACTSSPWDSPSRGRTHCCGSPAKIFSRTASRTSGTGAFWASLTPSTIRG